MSTITDKSCPYCRGNFKDEDTIVECPKCGIPHHEECWKENGGCSTFGCSEKHEESKEEVNSAEIFSEYICKNCETHLNEDQMFCSNCGTQRQKESVDKKLCSKCGNEVNENQSFCPKCGQKVGLEIEQNTISAINTYNQSLSNKKKKSKALPIIIAVVVLVIGVAGYFGYQYKVMQDRIIGIEQLIKDEKYSEAAKECSSFLTERKNEDVVKLLNTAQEGMKNEYKNAAASFTIKVTGQGVNLEGIGNTIEDYWHSYIYDNWSPYYSIDDAVSSALDDKNTDITKAESEKSDIDSLYRTLITPAYEDTEIIEIKACVKIVYDSYSDFYQFVTMPYNINYNNFSSGFSQRDKELANKIVQLSNLLK